MPIAGLVRLRKHQFGRQATFGTKVAATRAYPFTGVPSVDLQWTDPEVDAGVIAVTAPPERGAGEFTADLTFNSLDYNSAALLMCGFWGGEESPTGAGTARTWTHDPDVTTTPIQDFFTYEFGDDVVTDWYQFGDGIIESMELTGPEGLGPVQASTTWRFGSASSKSSTDSPVTGTVPTVGLAVSTTDPKVYVKDMSIAIASTVAGLGAGQVSDALHSFVLRFSGEVDEKRYANGSQSFALDDIGRVGVAVELEATWAKTADIVGTGSETDAWFSDDAVNRYVRLTFTSTTEAQSGTDYSWTMTMPMRYYTREEGEIGGNTTVVLNGHAFYDPDDFDGFFTSVLVNTLSNNAMGEAAS
jgi:hypothetical protein